jgi:hypothetical protein
VVEEERGRRLGSREWPSLPVVPARSVYAGAGAGGGGGTTGAVGARAPREEAESAEAGSPTWVRTEDEGGKPMRENDRKLNGGFYGGGREDRGGLPRTGNVWGWGEENVVESRRGR